MVLMDATAATQISPRVSRFRTSALALGALRFASHAFGLSPRIIVEFENTQLGHFFLAAPEETQVIDQGGAGPGWVRTGESFREVSVLTIGFTLVCRFYGSVSPGPNSHFFTSDPVECNCLRDLAASLPPSAPKWNYEGQAFSVLPTVVGTCPATVNGLPTLSVYRLYNRGFERGIDSNHRYTTQREIAEEMKRRGWAEEGVAWCLWPAQ